MAEHSFRAAIVGIALATLEGADAGRTAALVLLHDSPGSRIGDVPAVGRAYVTTAAPELAHDADKLETLLQAREYEAQGSHDTVQWQESSTAALRTDAAKELADAVLATTPTTWWSAFARSYTELRKHTRGTRDSHRRPADAPGAA